MTKGLIVLGTVGLDTIRVPSGVRRDILGGSAAHCAMSASLFTTVHLAAVVGNDFPGVYIRFLKRRGVNLTSLQVTPGCTFRWEGEYKPHDLNTACTLNTQLGVIDGCIPKLSPQQRAIRHVLLANYDPDVQAEVLGQMEKPTLVGLDTMNLWIDIKQASLLRLIKKAHILFMNDAEARALSGEKNLMVAAEHLTRLGPRIVIVKKGEHGCLLLFQGDFFVLPAFPVRRVLDPTGAGDTFAGGVMGYLNCCRKVTPRNLQRALAYGTLCASVNVEGFGMDRSSRVTRTAIEQRLRRFGSMCRL